MTAFPNKTSVPAPGVNRQAGLFLLNSALVILLLVTILSLPGGHAIHMAAGTIMLLGCSVHLALHGR